MRKRSVRIPALLLAALLCCQLAVTAAAAPEDRFAAGRVAAEELYALGLFRGVGTLPDGSPDFDLERTPTRGEGITMLVRLLGGEREAILADYIHFFQDAGWADDYIGYANYYDLSFGISQDLFGTENPMTQNEFLTVVLRALGYSDVDWRDPYPTAALAGLPTPDGEGLYRADVATICRDALRCKVKGEGVTLLAKLERQGAIGTGAAPLPAGPFQAGPVREAVTEFTAADADELVRKLAQATAGHPAEITIHVPAGQAESMTHLIDRSSERISYPLSDVSQYQCSYMPGGDTIWFTPGYSDAAQIMAIMEGKVPGATQEQADLANAAKRVLATRADPSMSDYELVKTIHDYLVDHTTYVLNEPACYTAAGCLLDGACVCDGYAYAFDLLCYLAGIDCMRIVGWGNGGGHAWNKVLVDGRWYNVDVTWDDPVSTRPILRWDYFLVSDSTLARDHQWTDYDFWPDAPSDYGRP